MNPMLLIVTMMISKRSGNDVDSRCSFDCFKSILVLVFAILFGILSLFSLLCLPDFIEKQLISTFILGPKSSTFSGWQKPNIPIYNYYYLFNITNADEIFRDGAKPDLQQLGPYVYRQSMEKTNISWNFANNTVQYRQVKSWFFDPTKSNGSLDDEIVHLNVPLISAIHKINLMPEEERFIAQESLNSMIESFSLATVMRHKISELLFDGYEDDLLKTASTLQPTEMQQARFSYLYGKNNTSTDGLFRIHTGGSDSAKSLGLMDTWNNENIISQWPSGEKCRSFNKSTAGDLLPPFYLEQNYRLMRYLGKQPILEPNPAIRMFIGEMCRSFELEFVEKFTKNQLRGYRYGLSTKSFDYTVDDNQCFCVEQNCPPNGLYGLGVCAQNAPIFLSNPHFLHAEQSLLDGVNGLEPDQTKHLFSMGYQEKLAVPIEIGVKFQINLLVKKSEDFDIMSEWPDSFNVYFPQFWFEIRSELDDATLNQLYFATEILPVILFSMSIILGIISLALVCYFFIRLLSIAMSPPKYNGNSKYESVRMLETKSNDL